MTRPSLNNAYSARLCLLQCDVPGSTKAPCWQPITDDCIDSFVGCHGQPFQKYFRFPVAFDTSVIRCCTAALEGEEAPTER